MLLISLLFERAFKVFDRAKLCFVSRQRGRRTNCEIFHPELLGKALLDGNII